LGDAMTTTRERPLTGRHAVVTGGGRGIGAAIADHLARQGAAITIMGRTHETLARSAAAIAVAHDVKVGVEVVDLAEPEQIERGFASATARLGPVTILINNAGIALPAPFLKTDLALWNRIFAVDAAAPFLCTRQVLKGMIDAGYGRVITISSTAGLTGFPYVSAYCAAKHATIGMTRALAREVAKTGVTVNCVCPGYTDTDIVAGALDNITAKTNRSREDALADIVSHNPQGRLIQPEEIAETVAWLCQSSSRSITGQSILIAGGELM